MEKAPGKAVDRLEIEAHAKSQDDVAHLGHAGVSQHALDITLSDGDIVAVGHGDHRKNDQDQAHHLDLNGEDGQDEAQHGKKADLDNNP